jgi:hypothetical protein
MFSHLIIQKMIVSSIIIYLFEGKKIKYYFLNYNDKEYNESHYSCHLYFLISQIYHKIYPIIMSYNLYALF